jgi:hypothetical protein
VKDDNTPEQSRDEELVEKVSEAIQQHPSNWREGLEELEFEWEDDGPEEETDTSPSNLSQQNIVDYFEGRAGYSGHLIDQLIHEVEHSDPPLFSRYFKQGNQQLLQLIVNGLARYPTSDLLLSGLDYFHEYRPILSQLIQSYLNSCTIEGDLEALEERCIAFIITTEPSGYDAAAALQEQFEGSDTKLKALASAIEQTNNSSDIISF